MKVVAACGLADLELPANVQITGHHVIPGNPLSRVKTLQPSLDESWRRNLSHSDLRMFERIGGKLNRKYGYV
jgi:hypothetical protein